MVTKLLKSKSMQFQNDFEVLQRDLHNPLSDCASLHVKFVELYSVYFKFWFWLPLKWVKP